MEINMKQLKILILVCLCCLNLGCSKADTMNNLATGESPSEEASAENGTENQETGKEKYYPGRLFDPVVFDDSVKEFMSLKKRLANYFDENNKEDIFDYIPPQKTNQILGSVRC